MMLLNHRRYSDSGEPLLILHGLFGNHGNWGWHARQLAENYSVYGLDLRNHGASPHHEDMTYADMAEDVRVWMQSMGLDSCHMIGHSMGGKVVMQLALAEPAKVRKLVVVDIVPVDYRVSSAAARHPALTAMRDMPLERLASRAEADALLRDSVPDAQGRAFLLTNLERLPASGYRWRLNLAAIEANLAALIAAPEAPGPFNGPTMFLFGEQSSYRQIEHLVQIRRLFPAAELQSVPGAGHWLNVDQPQASLEAIEQFLRKEGD